MKKNISKILPKKLKKKIKQRVETPQRTKDVPTPVKEERKAVAKDISAVKKDTSYHHGKDGIKIQESERNNIFKSRLKTLKTKSTQLLKWFWGKTYSIITKPFQLFKVICMTLGFLNIVVFVVCLIIVNNFMSSLPTMEDYTFKKAVEKSNRVIINNLELKRKKYRWVPLRKVSRDLLWAIVISEDDQFFEHDGVRFDSIINSILKNLRDKDFSFGGSTIDQQVVKNLFLNREKSITRKLKEIFIAKDLNRHFTKNRILELYLNLAEFGPDIFGVRSAAKHFFNKRPSEVNAAEGAFLALMLPSPRRNYYSIFKNKNLTREKKKKIRRILRGMLSEEFISLKQYQKYIKYNYFK